LRLHADFDVVLQAVVAREVERVDAELFAGGLRPARWLGAANAGQDERNDAVFFGNEELEASAVDDVFDDSFDAFAVASEEGQELLGA